MLDQCGKEENEGKVEDDRWPIVTHRRWLAGGPTGCREPPKRPRGTPALSESPQGGTRHSQNILPERRSTLSGYIVWIISRKT